MDPQKKRKTLGGGSDKPGWGAPKNQVKSLLGAAGGQAGEPQKQYEILGGSVEGAVGGAEGGKPGWGSPDNKAKSSVRGSGKPGQ